MSPRFVRGTAHRGVLVHAVWVPGDLPDNSTHQVIEREGRTSLLHIAYWTGKAECGQLVRGIVAGPHHGHDWDLVADKDKCPRCAKAVDGV